MLLDKDLVLIINIPGYTFASQPTQHRTGGVGFYIHDKCDFHLGDDLSETTEDKESMWIEIHSKFHRNVVCSVMYRHSNSKLENFSNYLTDAMEKISRENSRGDFNIELLNFETHNPTNEFINNIGVYCFQPHIIQPTRITAHSATLVDHIYFNSIDHYTISGKILTDLSDHRLNFSTIHKISCSTDKTVIYRRD